MRKSIRFEAQAAFARSKNRPWAAGQKLCQCDETEHGINFGVVAFQELYVPVLVVRFTAISISLCHYKLT